MIRKYSVGFLLFLLSTSFSLVAAEGVLRMIFEPVDYLEPNMVHDDVLGHKIEPNSAGHDSWGYRNMFVPLTTDIVTIGDSQTYGVSAPAKDSWPSVLSRMTGKSVYNLSLGGYNPTHYFYLLETKALNLSSSIIIVGLYYGNDLIGSYKSVYTNDRWKNIRSEFFLQDLKPASVIGDDIIRPEQYRFMGNLREWLSGHSVLYRMFTYSIGDIFRSLEMKYKPQHKDIIILEEKEHKSVQDLPL